jgi:hypothetical protein
LKLGRDQRCQKRKESKSERTKASTHSDRRAQQEGTCKNGKDAQDNKFLKERFLLSKEKKTNLKVRDREQGEGRLRMLKFRVRRKYGIYTCFRGRGRLREQPARLMGRKRFFISKPNQFGSVRVVRFKHYKTGNRTEPDIFLTILIGLIGFYFRFGFFGYFFPIFSV